MPVSWWMPGQSVTASQLTGGRLLKLHASHAWEVVICKLNFIMQACCMVKLVV